MRRSSLNHSFSKWLPWLVIGVLAGVATTLWQPLAILLGGERDPARLQAVVEQLGVLAPVGFFALNIIQIVGAPIPGYPVQILGGALFGTWLGGVYSIIGMTIGGLTSTWLTRRLGRPFVEKQVGAETLTKYENLARLESLWFWVILLTVPMGDFPYYIAGLSRVKYSILALAILISRGPFTFVISWVGATSLQAPVWIFWGIIAVVLSFVVLGYLMKDQLSGWLDKHVLHRLQ